MKNDDIDKNGFFKPSGTGTYTVEREEELRVESKSYGFKYIKPVCCICAKPLSNEEANDYTLSGYCKECDKSRKNKQVFDTKSAYLRDAKDFRPKDSGPLSKWFNGEKK